MIIAIDSGNKNIKTENFIFPSSLNVSKVDVGVGEDVLNYNGLCYTAKGARLSYMRDKTENENFFILALIGIAKEIEFRVEQGRVKKRDDNTYFITLLNGLPPKHMAQSNKFKNYFLRDEPISFIFNGVYYTLIFKDVIIFPQAYAAAATQKKNVATLPECLVVDIGGYTVDYMLLSYGSYNAALCKTLQDGVITLYDNIIEECMSAYDIKFSEDEIDDILSERNIELINRLKKIDEGIVDYIKFMTSRYIENIMYKLKQQGLDPRMTPTIFLGGGSVLLKGFIEDSPMVMDATFVDDIRANAKGYKILHRILSNKKAS